MNIKIFISQIGSGFKKFLYILFFAYILYVSLNSSNNSKLTDVYLKEGYVIKLTDDILFSTTDIKLKNIIHDRGLLIGEGKYDDGYYTKNNNFFVFNRLNNVNFLNFEDIIGNLNKKYAINGDYQISEFKNYELLRYSSNQELDGKIFFFNHIILIKDEKGVEILIMGEKLDLVDSDTSNILDILIFE